MKLKFARLAMSLFLLSSVSAMAGTPSLNCIQQGTGKSGTVFNLVSVYADSLNSGFDVSIWEINKTCSLSADQCQSLKTFDQATKSLLGNYTRVVNNTYKDFELDKQGFSSHYTMPAEIVKGLDLDQDTAGDMTFDCSTGTDLQTAIKAKQDQLK